MHPEHFNLSIPVYLPITFESCSGLLDAEGEKKLSGLTDPELAAVLVIQNLAQAAPKDLTSDATERVLAKLIAWTVDTPSSATARLLSEAQRLFDSRRLYFGLNTTKKLNLRFLLADEVSAREYLLPDGKWDVEYKVRHHRGNNPFSEQLVTPAHREHWLSTEQDKLVRTFRANLDEDLHVQGYAGIGKSHLLGALIECLQPEKTLLIAQTPAKLQTLRSRMGGARYGKTGCTFKDFALFLLQGPKFGSAGKSPTMLSKQALSTELNIIGFRAHDGRATLNICVKILEQYCKSRDYSLSAQHIPVFKLPLSSLESKVLLEYSSRLWTHIEKHPELTRPIGVETLFLIKKASLAGCVVPPRFTHILIDESQDAPSSLLQIIERGRQALVTLGDEYQQVKGAMIKRKSDVRQTDITYSIRSGRNIERLVNPLIAQHSRKIKIPFEGARNADVDIELYPENFFPPEDCVVMTASNWDIMKWAILIHDANGAFSFPVGEEQEFKKFMGTAIALFKPEFYSVEHNSDGLHPFFKDMPDWQHVRDANQYDDSFLWFEAELEKGFKISDMNRLYRKIGPTGKSCMLMIAEAAGGMEFDRVLLTPELMTNVKFRNPYDLDERICAVYIAISRAKQQLYIPYDVEEWIKYQKQEGYRESAGY
ncbi:hypothetical protein ALQ08_00835 [Pseudomonas syringae pv. delphinii]|uniref:Uncharacterized protein n=1 Tax=Pseudomonas syringae pv. delphinii TaxID=192088 RepID=A0A0N8RDC3_9PSED|nr:hypothetical protein [Pseudomonas syringae group genomosp. 3]KPX17191.1 Uncharacterized protein ALO72_00107 [Pseudomonas syringae pv. delphinii]RMP07896.1 hypothetical protein ALQ28_00429 [Pseudomonas syringae pv. delphinii]RMP24295.1 hypothetical protein ALQ27_02255 [Pseudomonas syringae pv. delphinii]RMQ25964.1 hypothetical protein ALQ08_00835 [Pseudomonas syringae pv. delphinii]